MKTPVFLLLLCASAASVSAADVDFSHDIVPLLREHCGKCHTGTEKKGGLSLNTRETLLVGGETGKAVVVGKSAESDLIKRLTSADPDEQMPPKGPRVPPAKVALIKKWIDEGVAWEKGFTFGKRAYDPPLKPRKVVLPPAASPARSNPVDRIIDSYLASQKKQPPAAVEDAAFARRVYLDTIGLLPTPEELDAFLADKSADKRAKLVRDLLARDVDYAEHWLTFFNDLLRNDYSGTGFITGGRKQVSKWLYNALYTNKPFDEFTRELIAPPSQESVGFIEGIRWRGDVSAGQTNEMQFAQSITQSFLGINLKCASCHDSFIDRWTLEESYSLAAIYANKPLELHRCDIPTGKLATAAWLFPELGTINAKASRDERLKQLAGLMTHRDNGRFTRTIVNRLWHRMMGRGIVHPTDAMQTEPWNSDLLDYLAEHLVESKYDLKATIELIATSHAYQSAAQVIVGEPDETHYTYGGPRARRLTAEQFMDAVWQITGSAPTKIDAPVTRGQRAQPSSDGAAPAVKPKPAPVVKPSGRWIWSRADTNGAAAGETVTLQRVFHLKAVPASATAVITCDNSYALYLNGKPVKDGDNWEAPDAVAMTGFKAGANELLIVAKNGGAGPNPAGLWFEMRLVDAKGAVEVIASDTQWKSTAAVPENGKFKKVPQWQPAAVVTADPWTGRVAALIEQGFAGGGAPASTGASGGLMVRASLMKNDFLMRSLGRPHREQIVSVRPAELSTLEAIDLSNGQTLADALAKGSSKLAARFATSAEFVTWLYRFALSRDPSAAELAAFTEALGPKLSEQGVQDALWAVIMLPEFQMVR